MVIIALSTPEMQASDLYVLSDINFDCLLYPGNYPMVQWAIEDTPPRKTGF
jgi:hypothetical protein